MNSRRFFGRVASSDSFDPPHHLDREPIIGVGSSAGWLPPDQLISWWEAALGDIGRVRHCQQACKRGSDRPTEGPDLLQFGQCFLTSTFRVAMHGGSDSAPVAKIECLAMVPFFPLLPTHSLLSSMTRSGPPVAKDGGGDSDWRTSGQAPKFQASGRHQKLEKASQPFPSQLPPHTPLFPNVLNFHQASVPSTFRSRLAVPFPWPELGLVWHFGPAGGHSVRGQVSVSTIPGCLPLGSGSISTPCHGDWAT